MKFDFLGKRYEGGRINPLVDYITAQDDNQVYELYGMKVCIDPTVDYNFQNVKIRWHDLVEGFNDRLIINSLSEFQDLFSKAAV